ncbi:fumarylacetoacetase [Ottowia thiooxydans]|uniref:fumarylacetoacetase n=1 Tax=Ottowia thiooxydans TaxID=219182 RepID=UPI0004191798|nr:fumarylacetoacetase [Ottowia thiooxydans]
MKQFLNTTHDPSLKSWVASANHPEAEFPIQNLPFSVFRRHQRDESFRGGVAIGDQVLDMRVACNSGIFTGLAAEAAVAAGQDKLNALMALGAPAWSALRRALSDALAEGSPAQSILSQCLVPTSEVEFDVPARIGGYTDFYTSIHHATNLGRQFRPDNPLLPNFKWIPIGYHGRTSSIGISGESITRPLGQVMLPGEDTPTVVPSRCLDMELELGIFIGPGSRRGEPVAIGEAEQQLFGLCLLNDWSTRDVQRWEYQPLGPFLAKNFASTISPWIVTMEALAPFRVPYTRSGEDPAPLPYLDSPENRQRGLLDIKMQADLMTPSMHAAGLAPETLCVTSYRHAYWTPAQLVAHHTMNGCNLQPGDMLGSGTMSGPGTGESAALIEITGGAKNPVALPSGESRTWLEDGDTVILRAWCERPGSVRIGFGACSGTILPSRPHAF